MKKKVNINPEIEHLEEKIEKDVKLRNESRFVIGKIRRRPGTMGKDPENCTITLWKKSF